MIYFRLEKVPVLIAEILIRICFDAVNVNICKFAIDIPGFSECICICICARHLHFAHIMHLRVFVKKLLLNHIRK